MVMKQLSIMICMLSLASLSVFVMPGMTQAAVVNLPQTGQTICYDNAGSVVDCAGTGQDGDLLAGVAWPVPRFIDNGDGTVTDNLTGLIWLQDGGCLGQSSWAEALTAANTLAAGTCGLSDGSSVGDWRLPNVNELTTLTNADVTNLGDWLNGLVFINVENFEGYWSSTSRPDYAYNAFTFYMFPGGVSEWPKSDNLYKGWAVRGMSNGPAQVWQTGQTNCYDNAGAIASCAGTGQDGEFQAGTPLPTPRFTDNGDGTITDNLTDLLWLKDADCFGVRHWDQALSDVNGLADGACGLTDGSTVGDWHMPNAIELNSLFDYAQNFPLLAAGHPFTNVFLGIYWTSTTHMYQTPRAYHIYISTGQWGRSVKSSGDLRFWPVRSAAPAPDLLINGDFEIEVPSNGTGGGWTSSDIGPFDSDGWVSTNCKEGSCFDLNGDANQVPTIEQTVTGLTAGATYELTGDYAIYAYNWTCNYSTRDGQMAIDINGVNHIKLDPPGCTTNNITWGPFATTFVAPSTDVTIAFRAQIDGDTDYAIDNIALVELQVLQAPDITVTPTTHDFGNITLGTTSDQTITVTNDGTENLDLGNLGTSAPLAAPFSLQDDNCSGQTLTPASNCTFAIRFAPTVQGPDSDAIDIPSNDPDEGQVFVNISGTGTTTPVSDITVTDSVAPGSDLQIPFGNVTEGTSSNQTATITNNGNADLILGPVADVNPLAAPFSVQNDTCSDQTLIPDASCSFDINFAPTVAGPFSDSLDVPSNDPDENSVTLSVSGTGLSSTTPDITVTDSVAPNNDLQVPFGSMTVGTASDQTVTVVNGGNADLVLGTIATANSLAAPFIIENNACDGQTLAPAESCAFNLRFSPTAAGVFNESFDIPSNDQDEGSVTVNVSGTGTAIPVPDITVTDTVDPLDDLKVLFGEVTEGLTTDQTVTLFNDGNADLVIGDIAGANPVADPFAIFNDTCSGQTLLPTTDCTFDVSFTPIDTSTSNDSFDVPSNDPDEGSLTINLSGTGLSSVTNNSPGKPRLVFPANGQEQVETNVTFRWRPVSDPDGDLVSYDVFYCTGADPFQSCEAVQVTSFNGQNIGGRPNGNIYYAGIGSGVVMLFFGVSFAGRLRGRKKIALLIAMTIAIGGLLMACGSSSNSNDETFAVEGLDSGTQYYWGVVAKDGQGGQTQSDVWSFTTL